jgi:tetratricopeptide (TPR) repeat protein
LKNLCVLLNIKGKVLMTTRLTPRAVEQRGELLDGCHEIELKAMQKGDAVAFFRAQGIRGVRAEIEVACEPYGYHPLSLRILAGLIANDRETPGDIAVAGKLDITDDIIANKSHVLKVAYDTLSSEQQKLLSHIACFRFAMSYDALKAISDKDIKDYLAILEHRGLLHWDKTANKYDLHPIVRRYAYERLTVPDRTAAHNRLRDYFEAVPKPQKVERLEDLTPVIELYHHTVRSKEYHAAWTLYDSRLRVPLYYRFGKYQEDIELLQALSDAEVLPNVGSRRDQTWILLYLSMDHERIGQLLKALTLNDQALALNRDKISLEDWGSCLVERASVSRYLGLLKDAESNIAESTMLFDSLQSANWIGISHRNYGNVLIVCGRLVEAKSQLDIAEQIYRVSENRFLHGLSRTFIYRSILLEQSGDSRSAVNYAQKARSYAIRGNYLREMVMANCRLGRMYLESGSLTDADTKFREALLECRKMNLLDLEPEVLLGLASVRFELAEYSEAMKLAEEALLITERCGYVLQGADVHLFLAELALEGVKLQVESEMSDKEAARLHAEKALELATCDGPPYYYKVAYEEAERFLEKL